jgi:CRISPR-associated exonuclease Cas4
MDAETYSPWADDDRLLISSLEHWRYCPRQCALIHLERTFDENVYTLRGRFHHRKVDQEGRELREGVRVEYALPLWSDRLGLVGKADVVEFHGATPYPVEHKVGRRRSSQAVVVQLCAQATCLAEMTAQPVPRGAVYYYGSRRRREIVFTPRMYQEMEQTVAAVRQMLRRGRLPPPVCDARCRLCSLQESCAPDLVALAGRVQRLVAGLFSVNND